MFSSWYFSFDVLLYDTSVTDVNVVSLAEFIIMVNLRILIILAISRYTVDLENFGVKKFRIAHTSTKLKHTRFLL